jgi:hypothetical protein
MGSRRPMREEQNLVMTEPCPFDDMEALAWLPAQPDGRVTASATEPGRHSDWNRMRAVDLFHDHCVLPWIGSRSTSQE